MTSSQVRIFHKPWETCKCRILATMIKDFESVESMAMWEAEDYDEAHLIIFLKQMDNKILDLIKNEFGMRYVATQDLINS